VKDVGGVELREVEPPVLEDGSLIVEMKASGVCGTDIEKTRGRNITSPILGHEVAGIVAESGINHIHAGTRVVPHHHVACGKCDYCRRGAETMCTKFKTSNFQPCGFAERFLVPRYNVQNGGVHVFDSSISFEEASFAEPFACCIRGQEKVFRSLQGFSEGSVLQAAVIGAGPIGLMHMELLRKRFPNAKILAVDINDLRLFFAEREEGALVLNPKNTEEGLFSQKALALSNAKEGFDLVIVATGSPKAIDEAIRCVRKSGSLLLFGAPHRGTIHQLDLARFFLDELNIVSSYSATDRELDSALRLIEGRVLDVSKFISKRYPLERIGDAFDSAMLDNSVKIVVSN